MKNTTKTRTIILVLVLLMLLCNVSHQAYGYIFRDYTWDRDISVSPSGKYIAVTEFPDKVILLNGKTHEAIASYFHMNGIIRRVVVLSDDEVISGSDNEILVYSISGKQIKRRIKLTDSIWLLHLMISPDHKYIVTRESFKTEGDAGTKTVIREIDSSETVKIIRDLGIDEGIDIIGRGWFFSNANEFVCFGVGGWIRVAIPKGNIVGYAKSTQQYQCGCYIADTNQLIFGTLSGLVEIWDADKTKMMDEFCIYDDHEGLLDSLGGDGSHKYENKMTLFGMDQYKDKFICLGKSPSDSEILVVNRNKLIEKKIRMSAARKIFLNVNHDELIVISDDKMYFIDLATYKVYNEEEMALKSDVLLEKEMFTTLEKGKACTGKGLSTGRKVYILPGMEEFTVFYRMLKGPESITPVIDFSKYRIIVLLDTSYITEGHEIQITSMVYNRGKDYKVLFTVLWDTELEEQLSIIRPYHIIQVPMTVQ